MVRDLLARVFGSHREVKKHEATVHDYTYDFSKSNLTLVKPIDDGRRAFLSGKGTGIVSGDLLIVMGQCRPHLGMRLKYRVERVDYTCAVSWRAYATLEQATENVSRQEARRQRRS